jgi:hypothetical protein
VPCELTSRFACFALPRNYRTVDLVTKPPDAQIWLDFARLVEEHHGVWAWGFPKPFRLSDLQGYG